MNLRAVYANQRQREYGVIQSLPYIKISYLFDVRDTDHETTKNVPNIEMQQVNHATAMLP